MARRLLWLVIFCSFAAVIVTRWPYRSRALFSWDSANFALAVDRIDIAAHRPHPPGYIGYVFAARALRWVTGDVNAALVLWNVLATILTAMALAFFAWDADGTPRRAMTASCAWAVIVTSPLLWFYGEIAEIYVSELLVSLLVAYSAWRVLQERAHGIEWCAAALAVTMLFKVTAALFLLPLVIYTWAASPRRDGRRAAALLSATGAAVVLLFLVIEPRIFQVTWSQFAAATSGSRLVEGIASSGLRTFNRNLRDTLTAGLAGLGVINALALIVWAVTDRRTPTSLGWRVPALWIGPWLTFLVLVHIGRPGYVLPLLAPAALILGSFYARQRPAVAAALVVAQALVNVAHFTSVHPFSDATTGGTLTYRDKTIVQRAASDLQPLTLPTAFTIAQSDAVVDRLEHVAAEQCPDGKLVIVAGSEPVDWRRVMWYLPAATSIYVVDRVPIYVAQHTDFSPVPQAGLVLESRCPMLWLAPDGANGAAPEDASASVTVAGLGLIFPPGASVHVSSSGIRTTR
jgi:hypothetical protein